IVEAVGIAPPVPRPLAQHRERPTGLRKFQLGRAHFFAGHKFSAPDQAQGLAFAHRSGEVVTAERAPLPCGPSQSHQQTASHELLASYWYSSEVATNSVYWTTPDRAWQQKS